MTVFSTTKVEKPRITIPGSDSPTLRRFAQFAVIFAAIFAGVAIALQVPATAPFPGTTGDKVMRTLSYTAVFAIAMTALKLIIVKLFGGWIERKTGRGRVVNMRHIFDREIRWSAIAGGALAAVYSIAFVWLVQVLAPSALAAGRACVVLTLVVVEIIFRVLPRGGVRFYLRLALSLAITLAGAGTVIFAGGFQLFPDGSTDLWVFLGFITIGNLALAFAEYAELHGVQKNKVSAPVYTAARFVYYTATCLIAVVTWGLINEGWSVTWGVAQMCWDRMEFLLPLALLAGFADLIRICVKTIVSATYMYVVGSLAVATDVLVQTVAKMIAPDVYANVHGGWTFPLIAVCGGLVVWGGAILYPHRADKKNAEMLPAANLSAS